MVVVHKMFRREFGEASKLVHAVAPGDRKRVALVVGHLKMLSLGLHHHHEGEDELLWPVLLERVALQANMVRRMESQHARLSELLDRSDNLLDQWQTRADAVSRDELADVLLRVSAALDEHLADEENEVLPLVTAHLSIAEWQALMDRGQEGIPKGSKGFVLLGMILRDCDPGERAAFLALVPTPVRVLWRVVGTRIYERERARLSIG
jgi:hypothetical protein